MAWKTWLRRRLQDLQSLRLGRQLPSLLLKLRHSANLTQFFRLLRLKRQTKAPAEALTIHQPLLEPIPKSESPEEIRTGLLLLAIALLITLLFHGVLLFNHQFYHTYDALIHIFFGAHYRDSWFDPWEPRWYTGFLTIAYPPLSHQLIAILGKVTDLLTSFAFVQLFALLQLVVGMFRFSRLLVGARAAGLASLALALSSSIAETVHVFGQLPTTLSLGFLLNSQPFIWRYISKGRLVSLVQALCWTAVTTSAHHVTTLFGSVFFTGPIVVIAVLRAFHSPRPTETQQHSFRAMLSRRLYRLLPAIYRTGIFGVGAITLLIMVVFPYWYWSRLDPITQMPIPHGSRANFLVELNLGLMFWLIPWASSLIFLPYASYKGLLSWRWPVTASMLLLFVLGTGGTTPIPKLLLRGAFDILTLDRFTFWASMLIIPFMGLALESLVFGRGARALDAYLGQRVRYALLGFFLIFTCMLALAISTLSRYRPFQPEPIEMGPIVNFINKDEHWRYRYLNLGFGDQMAWLSANTQATTPDGNYHSARRLPELTTSPVERLEGAKYTGVPGIGSLEQFLTMPEKYHLKFVFSNDAFYDPLLYFNGWHSLGSLENGIVVWEREDIPPLPERLPRKTWPLYQVLMWGLLPFLSLFAAYGSLLLKPKENLSPQFWQRWPFFSWCYRQLKEDKFAEVQSAWQPWRDFLARLEGLNFKRLSFSKRLRNSLLLVLVGLSVLGFALKLWHKPQESPEYAVLHYWDAIDFKRFSRAYEWLVPQNGLDYERWLLDLSVQGGLRSGFAKLKDIELEALESDRPDPNRVVIRAKLTWLTALSSVQESHDHELIRTAKGWRISQGPNLIARPKKRFEAVPMLDYYRAPRRLTTATTSAWNVLDRPRMQVLQARLLSYETSYPDPQDDELTITTTQLSIVGEVQNTDAYPADMTVTALLRDAMGEEISRNNAGLWTVHKVLPGETVPFRIDFSAVSAPEDISQVKDADIYVKAVVAKTDLSRDLLTWSQVQAPVGGEDGGLEHPLRIITLNQANLEATFPQLLLSLYDDKGLAWLEGSFALEAIGAKEIK
ncbi:MAG: hypothetical protein R2880_18500 [Deinococcales bacterium]